MSLVLHNPHSILAALRARPRDVLEVRLPSDPSDAWAEVAVAARQAKVPLRDAGGGGPKGPPRGPAAATQSGRTSGAHAVVKPRAALSSEELFKDAKKRARGCGLWLALDSLQDPQNVGAIFRTAAFFGVQGILLTQERSAPLSEAAYDVASGGIEGVPFTLQVNLQRAFEQAKEAGLWILGSSEHAKDSLSTLNPDRPWLLVVGNEEKGMRRLTAEACDVTCTIPARGEVGSLNVSAAAAILIAHLSV